MSLYHVTWGQCSIIVENKLKGKKVFKTVEKKTDISGLLKEIKSMSNKVEESMNIFDSIDEIQRRYFLYRKSDEDDNITHYRNSKI